jgi:2-(1,2-epoxy-1,2-dihydrophenyl)acetyl-CoA isomerase
MSAGPTVRDVGLRRFGDVTVELGDDFVAVVQWHRAPNNFFDLTMIRALADALDYLDANPHCRAAVLCSEGKHFCAGADLGGGRELGDTTASKGKAGHLYDEAVRLFSSTTPMVAAVQGAAVGGGLGLALVADFRIAARDARFSANFALLGFHHGFGLTATLPAVVGQQKAWEMLYTGQRVSGEGALEIGLCDRISSSDSVMDEARSFAGEIAKSAPLALRAIRDTMRSGLADRVREATDREKVEQERLSSTDDFREGVRANAERRSPHFTGR